MKFGDLRTGDVVNLMGTHSVILAIEKPHPLNVNFWLVVWYIFKSPTEPGRLSFDMLHPRYDLLPGTSVSQDGMYAFQKAMAEIRP